jgi:hypothetical protein
MAGGCPALCSREACQRWVFRFKVPSGLVVGGPIQNSGCCSPFAGVIVSWRISPADAAGFGVFGVRLAVAMDDPTHSP